MFGGSITHECCPQCGRAFEMKERHGIDFSDFGVKVDGKPIHFTKTERLILRDFARAYGRFIHKEFLLQGWDEGEVQPKIVDVMICKLRKKLADTPLMIENQWGEGYRLIRRAQNVENVETQHATQETAA